MLKKLLYILGFVSTAILAGLLYVINMMIVRPTLAPIAILTDKDYTDFYSKTKDNLKIRGCFYKGKAGAGTILLCHGHGVTLEYMNDTISFLRKRGYSLLLLDFRAHGKSEGKYTSIGVNEWMDIAAILSKAKELGYINDKTPIAAYGRSMGAAALINGSSHLPQIKLFILESSFEELRRVAARDGWRVLKLPDTFVTDIIFWVVSKVTGIDYVDDKPVNKAVGIGKRPTLLIHDELDPRATLDSFNALKSKIPRVKTYIAKSAWHVKAHKTHPVEFEKQFLDFLDANNFPSAN